MFLKTEIMLIAEKLRPTCMTQFPRYILYKAGGGGGTKIYADVSFKVLTKEKRGEFALV
jgi:hypothetical protein